MHPDSVEGPVEDLYIVLGIPREASLEEVEQAYFDLARRLHPDVAGGGDEATARFMLINEAYQTLISPVLRREYDKGLGIQVDSKSYVISVAKPAPGKTVASVPMAPKTKEEPRAGAAQRLDEELKRAIKSADRLCGQGNFWQASDLLQRILSKYPRQPALRRALARAAVGMLRYREAAEHLKVACELEYFNSDNHVLLGEVYMKGKQWQKAKDSLHDALSWNEESERAKKGLLLIEKELAKSDSPLKKLLSKISRSVVPEKKPEPKKQPPKERSPEPDSDKRG